MMNLEGIEISWLGHAALKIKASEKLIYIDPFQIKGSEPADLILITHPHYDHCSISDIMKIAKDGTMIICTADSQSAITKLDKKVNLQLIEPGEKITYDNIEIHAVPSYNIGKIFHQKSDGWVGYVARIGKIIIYHAGDTDFIDEMKKLSGYAKHDNKFIAFLPVGGKFTMNAEEAAKAAKVINANITVPIHYGSIIGSEKDAEIFVKLCEDEDVNARIFEKE